jgi:hypothetical protein
MHDSISWPPRQGPCVLEVACFLLRASESFARKASVAPFRGFWPRGSQHLQAELPRLLRRGYRQELKHDCLLHIKMTHLGQEPWCGPRDVPQSPFKGARREIDPGSGRLQRPAVVTILYTAALGLVLGLCRVSRTVTIDPLIIGYRCTSSDARTSSFRPRYDTATQSQPARQAGREAGQGRAGQGRAGQGRAGRGEASQSCADCMDWPTQDTTRAYRTQLHHTTPH